MKKRRWIVTALVGCLLLGGLWWFRTGRMTGSPVTLVITTNRPAIGAVFHLTNGGDRAILLTDVIVETNSPTGWQAASHTVPSHPQRLAMGEGKDLTVSCPMGADKWRLRLTYGSDVKGPLLALAKVEYAISEGSWPSRAFGIMAGSNSCVSVEMPR